MTALSHLNWLSGMGAWVELSDSESDGRNYLLSLGEPAMPPYKLGISPSDLHCIALERAEAEAEGASLLEKFPKDPTTLHSSHYDNVDDPWGGLPWTPLKSFRWDQIQLAQPHNPSFSRGVFVSRWLALPLSEDSSSGSSVSALLFSSVSSQPDPASALDDELPSALFRRTAEECTAGTNSAEPSLYRQKVQGKPTAAQYNHAPQLHNGECSNRRPMHKSMLPPRPPGSSLSQSSLRQEQKLSIIADNEPLNGETMRSVSSVLYGELQNIPKDIIEYGGNHSQHDGVPVSPSVRFICMNDSTFIELHPLHQEDRSTSMSGKEAHSRQPFPASKARKQFELVQDRTPSSRNNRQCGFVPPQDQPLGARQQDPLLCGHGNSGSENDYRFWGPPSCAEALSRPLSSSDVSLSDADWNDLCWSEGSDPVLQELISVFALIERTFVSRLLNSFAFKCRESAPQRCAQNHGEPSSSATYGGSSVPESSNGSADSNTKKRSSKRRRKEDETGDDHDDGSDGGDHTHDKAGLSKQGPQLLACPYCKWKPRKYRSCYEHCIRNTWHLKQHLRRCHQVPLHCPYCYDEFRTQKAWTKHMRPRTCPDKPEKTWEQIDDEKRELLKKRLPKENTREENWYLIYEILFPGAERPATPFADKPLPLIYCEIEDHIRDEGNPLLLELVRAEFNNYNDGLWFLQSDVEQLLTRNFERVVELLFDRWERRRMNQGNETMTVPEAMATNYFADQIAITDGADNSLYSQPLVAEEIMLFDVDGTADAADFSI